MLGALAAPRAETRPLVGASCSPARLPSRLVRGIRAEGRASAQTSRGCRSPARCPCQGPPCGRQRARPARLPLADPRPQGQGPRWLIQNVARVVGARTHPEPACRGQRSSFPAQPQARVSSARGHRGRHRRTPRSGWGRRASPSRLFISVPSFLAFIFEAVLQRWERAQIFVRFCLFAHTQCT